MNDPTSDNLSPNDQSEAHAINGLGEIVGGSAHGATPEHAWIWTRNAGGGTTTVDLGTLYGGSTSRALAINNRGQVVGWASGSTGTTYAFIWVPGWTSIRDLRTFLSTSDQASWPNLAIAFGITDDGVVVGYGTQSGSSYTTAFAIKPK